MMRATQSTMFLVCVCAVNALLATSASAETTLLAEWLINGSSVTALTSTEGTGKVRLGDTKIGLHMTCEAIVDGSVGPNGEGEVTEILVGGLAISLSNHSRCTGENGCSNAEAAVEQLPGLGQAELLESGAFGAVASSATYWTKCTVLGISAEEECTVTNGLGLLKNGATGVEPEGEVTPKANCTVGGAGSGEEAALAGDLLKTLTGVLSISE